MPSDSRFADLTWDEVFPLVAETWTESHHDHVAAIGAVLEDLGSPWTSWRAEHLSAPDLADTFHVTGDPVSVGIAIARETALDHRQRAVDVPVDDLKALQRARVELRAELLDARTRIGQAVDLADDERRPTAHLQRRRGRLRARGNVSGQWICDHCGATGGIPDGDTADYVLCDQCGSR